MNEFERNFILIDVISTEIRSRKSDNFVHKSKINHVILMTPYHKHLLIDWVWLKISGHCTTDSLDVFVACVYKMQWIKAL